MQYFFSFFFFAAINELFLCLPVQAKWIIGGIIASVIVLVIYLICTSDERQEKYMKEKFGEDYQEKLEEMIKEKGLESALMIALPCEPDPTFVSQSTIEKKAKVSLPDFVVTECYETLPDFTGDFHGEAIIEFDEVISDSTIKQIEKKMTSGHSKWSKKDEDLYTCDLSVPFEYDSSDYASDDVFWSISIRRNSKEGNITYGRI